MVLIISEKTKKVSLKPLDFEWSEYYPGGIVIGTVWLEDAFIKCWSIGIQFSVHLFLPNDPIPELAGVDGCDGLMGGKKRNRNTPTSNEMIENYLQISRFNFEVKSVVFVRLLDSS